MQLFWKKQKGKKPSSYYDEDPQRYFQYRVEFTLPSADNLDFISPLHLDESFRMIVHILDVLENDRTCVSLNPKCEPQLGKRGLYQAIGGDKDAARKQMAMLWALNLADGEHSVLDMAERAGIPFVIADDPDLLKVVDTPEEVLDIVREHARTLNLLPDENLLACSFLLLAASDRCQT